MMIHGNGPRKDICARCGVEKGLVEKEETPVLYEKGLANARLNLVARRYSPWFWLVILWAVWFVLISSIAVWKWVILGILLISTLSLPVLHILSSAKYAAAMAKLTPEYETPKGH
tara:strand:+ start:563 stop:907 length:345 start_codon:yes stop_codon:yes gene_type:complete